MIINPELSELTIYTQRVKKTWPISQSLIMKNKITLITIIGM